MTMQWNLVIDSEMFLSSSIDQSDPMTTSKSRSSLGRLNLNFISRAIPRRCYWTNVHESLLRCYHTKQ